MSEEPTTPGSRKPGESSRWSAERITRLAVRAAIVVAVLWLAGIAFLWLVWPR